MKHCPNCSKKDIDDNVLFCPKCGTAVFVGAVLDKKYHLDKLIGEGGMGQVYRATHIELGKHFAIKILPPAVATGEKAALERFLNEAKTIAKINHENVINISDFGTAEDSGLVYLVMEYLKGMTLKEMIEKKKRLGYREMVLILEKVCDAMTLVHGKGIVHRDLKPHNIFLARGEDDNAIIKVLDFGIAIMGDKRYTKTGQLIGSVEYMSPEHCNGKELDARSDIYTLGVDLYEMITGRVPFPESEKGPSEILYQHLFQQPSPLFKLRPDIPEQLEEVVLRALNKNPKLRQQTVRQLSEEFKKALMKADDSLSETLEPINLSSISQYDDTVTARNTPVKSPAEYATKLIEASHDQGTSRVGSRTEKKILKDPEKERGIRASKPTADMETPQPAPGVESRPEQKKSRASLLVAVALFLIAATVAIIAWPRIDQKANGNISSGDNSIAAPPAIRERSISYWGELQRYKSTKPVGEPVKLTGGIAGETYFSSGDGIKFFLTSSENGFLYIVTQESGTGNEMPNYTILFPTPGASSNSSGISPHRAISTEECIFEGKTGTEKVFIVWSANQLPEFEEMIRKWVNESAGAEIKDPEQVKFVSNFLEKHSGSRPQLEYDGTNERVNLRSREEILVYPLKLNHR
jgi:serine/threonine protein kinase